MFRPVAQTLLEDLREAGEGPVAAVAIGSTLRAITAASRIALAAERGGIVADFARRMAAARASCDPRLLAGILRAIKEQRRAALAIASRNVGRESYEKRQAVLQGRPSPGYAARRNFTGAKRIARRAPVIASETLAPAPAYLSNALDWLNLWHGNAGSQWQGDFAPSAPIVPHL